VAREKEGEENRDPSLLFKFSWEGLKERSSCKTNQPADQQTNQQRKRMTTEKTNRVPSLSHTVPLQDRPTTHFRLHALFASPIFSSLFFFFIMGAWVHSKVFDNSGKPPSTTGIFSQASSASASVVSIFPFLSFSPRYFFCLRISRTFCQLLQRLFQ